MEVEKDISLSTLKWTLSLYSNTFKKNSSHENLSYAKLKLLLFKFIVPLTQHTVQLEKRKPKSHRITAGTEQKRSTKDGKKREKRGKVRGK